MKPLWFALVGSIFGALGCTPDFDDRPYLVERARLLAVLAEPAEARPRDTVTLTPVVAGRAASEPSFRFCTKAPSLADPRPIAEACLDEPGIALEPQGVAARGTIPGDACARFGPDPTSSNVRPNDADATGGFYQPVIVDGFGPQAVSLLRIHCSLPDAPADLARELDEGYTLNQNPELSGLATPSGRDFQSDVALPAGAATELSVSWPAGSRERYLWLPPAGDAVVAQDESLRVSWFVSSGALAASASGDATAASTVARNTFTPDPGTATVELWVVLQDSRGGSAARHWQLHIAPDD